jgi:hypothetical protein
MGLDIRLPIGLMFVVLGPIILVTGLVRGESLSIRTGGAMCVFGLFMLVMGIRGQKRANAEALAEAPPEPEAEKAKGGSSVAASDDAAARSALAEAQPDSVAPDMASVPVRAAHEESVAQV